MENRGLVNDRSLLNHLVDSRRRAFNSTNCSPGVVKPRVVRGRVLGGFPFSSYGEESNTLGKIRDWLAGGITALTVANVASIKAILSLFVVSSAPQE
jgi:hypothetical protein